jgi:hypothetical protein
MEFFLAVFSSHDSFRGVLPVLYRLSTAQAIDLLASANTNDLFFWKYSITRVFNKICSVALKLLLSFVAGK